MSDTTWRCATCNEVHHDLPMVYGAPPPLALFDLPPDQLATRVQANADMCVVDGAHFFVRAHLELPVTDMAEPFAWSVWVALTEEGFQQVVDTWEDDDRDQQPPMPVWLATELPSYPSTVRLQGTLHQAAPGVVPRFDLAPSDHPLAVEQVHGIARARVIAFAEQLLHEQPPVTDATWSLVQGWVQRAPVPVEVLPCSPSDGARALAALGVSTRSPLGAVAHFTGGLLVDHGWLRILGGGCDRLRAIDRWNHTDAGPRFDHGILVADDVLGGFFAWMAEARTIFYLAPDTLQWHDLGIGYSDWLEAALGGALADFYADVRPQYGDHDLPAPDRGVMVYPPLPFAAEGERSRRLVPIDELWAFHSKLSNQLGAGPEGGPFDLS